MIRKSQLKIEKQQNIGKKVSQFDTFGKCERPFYLILRWDKLTLAKPQNHPKKSDIPVYIDGKGRGLFLLFLFIPL